MKQRTQKALKEYSAVRKRIEKLIAAGKIDLHKPSCLYSKKEMAMIKQLLEKEKKAREKYYALLSKDMQLEVAELCGAKPEQLKQPGCSCRGCKKVGG
jgi:hypothetical protein